MAAIVYHAPFPLDREASSASGIRPVRMLDAFRELGYTVLDVTGSARERSRRLRAVVDVPGTSLTICTRPDQWEAAGDQYTDLVEAAGGRIEVVHRSGEELTALYERADLCVLFVEPDPYREFASPVKLYEYLGRGKPVIASQGTLAAEVVGAAGAGWTLPYDAAVLSGLLRRLLQHPQEIAEAAGRARQARQEHTWLSRARTVAQDMQAVRAGALAQARTLRAGGNR